MEHLEAVFWVSMKFFEGLEWVVGKIVDWVKGETAA